MAYPSKMSICHVCTHPSMHTHAHRRSYLYTYYAHPYPYTARTLLCIHKFKHKHVVQYTRLKLSLVWCVQYLECRHWNNGIYSKIDLSRLASVYDIGEHIDSNRFQNLYVRIWVECVVNAHCYSSCSFKGEFLQWSTRWPISHLHGAPANSYNTNLCQAVARIRIAWLIIYHYPSSYR